MLTLILLLALIILIFLYFKALKRINDLIFEKQSISVKHGKMAEQFFPFIDTYPYDRHNFRFIGSPIDGIQFEDDKIIFVEFKIGDSKLSEKQKRVKEAIEKKRVEFMEFRVR